MWKMDKADNETSRFGNQEKTMLLLNNKTTESGAPWVSKSGNLSMREILVLTSAYARTPVQTLGEGGGGECHLF